MVRTRASVIAVAPDGGLVQAGARRVGHASHRARAHGRRLRDLHADARIARVRGGGGARPQRGGDRVWRCGPRRNMEPPRGPQAAEGRRPDHAFAANGVVELASGLPPVGLAVAGDGSTFVALPDGVLRLLPDGTPDPGFGRDGVTTAGVRVGDRITGVQLDSLSRPLVTILTPFDTPHNKRPSTRRAPAARREPRSRLQRHHGLRGHQPHRAADTRVTRLRGHRQRLSGANPHSAGPASQTTRAPSAQGPQPRSRPTAPSTSRARRIRDEPAAR